MVHALGPPETDSAIEERTFMDAALMWAGCAGSYDPTNVFRFRQSIRS